MPPKKKAETPLPEHVVEQDVQIPQTSEETMGGVLNYFDHI